LATRRLEQDQYEVCCLPFFAYGVNIGDMVRAAADPKRGGYPVWTETVRASGLRTFRLGFTSTQLAAAHGARLHHDLEAGRFWHEWLSNGYVSVCWRSEQELEALRGLTADLTQRGWAQTEWY
jgi:hypothetical protein